MSFSNRTINLVNDRHRSLTCTCLPEVPSGVWERRGGWRGGCLGYKCALKEPSHVTWWKRMYCGASAGQDSFVMLFVLCLIIILFSFFLLFILSMILFYTSPPFMKKFWHDEIHTTLPCPSQGPPSLLCTTSFINIHPRGSRKPPFFFFALKSKRGHPFHLFL